MRGEKVSRVSKAVCIFGWVSDLPSAKIFFPASFLPFSRQSILHLRMLVTFISLLRESIRSSQPDRLKDK